MTNLERLQTELGRLGYQGMVVPSTDEYLSEFAPPSARRLEWATNFRGSTGLAVVLQAGAALFLDGRYKVQGEVDCTDLPIDVLDADEVTRQAWLGRHLKIGDRLAVDTRLQSQPDIQRITQAAASRGIEVHELHETNPIDRLWGSARPTSISSKIFDYSPHYAGVAADEKCRQVKELMAAAGMECQLVADPEDVAWLLNIRTNDSEKLTPSGWHVVPVPMCRALIEASGEVIWFVDRSRLEAPLAKRIESAVRVVEPSQFERFLTERCRGKIVGANLARTPFQFAEIVARVGTLRDDNSLVHRRWRKHPNEVERAREGHFVDGQAVIRFLAWLQRTVLRHRVTEIEAGDKLTEFRGELAEYRGLSMPLMSASGVSGSLPHYIPSQHSNRTLNDHPIYWMDSGAQYYGCSTDNTVCFAVSRPQPRHVRAHTLVVKGLIALSEARFPVGTLSSQLDALARQPLWQAGMDYDHGTSHGVGNFMNIHEGPMITKRPNHPWVAPLDAGMILSNEPAFYAPGDFGVRVESHLATVESQYAGYLEFETISRLPIDPQLMDASLLTRSERHWLALYHGKIAQGYQGRFDPQTAQWLQALVDAYVAMDQ